MHLFKYDNDYHPEDWWCGSSAGESPKDSTTNIEEVDCERCLLQVVQTGRLASLQLSKLLRSPGAYSIPLSQNQMAANKELQEALNESVPDASSTR